MHRKASWHMIMVAVAVVAALFAGMVAGCGGSTTTITETKTATAAGTGGTVTVTQTVTQTVAPPATTTTSPTGPRQTIKLSIGMGHPMTTVWVTALDDFFVPEVSKRVEQRTNYKIEWNKAWGGSVAKLGEELEAVETGLLDIALSAPAFEPTKLFALQFTFWMPFDCPDPLVASQAAGLVFQDFPELMKSTEQYNQKNLGYSVSADYGLITSFPVTGPQDLKGRKIAGAGANLSFLGNTGAVPVQSTYVDAYTAMATGVYNGFISDIVANISYKMYEVAPYRTEVGFGSKFNTVLNINLDTWKKLPKEVQDILVEVGKEYNQFEAQMVAGLMAKGSSDLKAAGGHWSELSSQAKMDWANVLPNVPAEKAKEIEDKGFPGTEIFKSYQKHLQELGYQVPRQWL